MPKATISLKGQISIPKSIRDRLSLKPGTQVDIEILGEQVVMKRLVSGFPDWRTMRGMVRNGSRRRTPCRTGPRRYSSGVSSS